jgi:hypothetical protein
MLLSAMGTGIGYKVGEFSKNQVAGITNSFSNTMASKPTGILTIEGPYTNSAWPSVAGNIGGSVAGEGVSAYGQSLVDYLKQFMTK